MTILQPEKVKLGEFRDNSTCFGRVSIKLCILVALNKVDQMS